MRLVAGMVLTGVAVSMLAACGGGSSNSTKAAASASPNGANGFAAYTACLRQHGVTLPSFSQRSRPSDRPSGQPGPDRSPGSDGFGSGFGGGFGGRGGFFGNADNPPQGIDATTWKSAVTACQSARPTFNGGRPNNGAFLAYRNCLSDHGVNMSSGPGGLQTSDPKVAAALKTCAPLRPTATRRPNPSPSPTNG